MRRFALLLALAWAAAAHAAMPEDGLSAVFQAIEANHEIVPVLNKIDLPAAEPERVKQQIEDVIGLDATDAVEISAKTGLNIEGVLEALGPGASLVECRLAG